MIPAPIQVVRHVAFEDLGTMARLFRSWRLSVEYVDPPRDDLVRAADAKLLIVMGGPISVNDVDRFRYLGDEVELIRRRIERGLPEWSDVTVGSIVASWLAGGWFVACRGVADQCVLDCIAIATYIGVH